MKRAKVKWIENLKFVGDAPSGHSILMDASPEVGGDNAAVRPGELTLLALGGCTGIDVVSMLKKMRVKITDFEIIVDADQRPEHPKSWERIHIKYIITGPGIDEDKVKRAIELSQDKYCSVSDMLKKGAEVTHSYEIISD